MPATESYPDVDPRPRFPEIEERLLAFWAAEGIFGASIDQRDPSTSGDKQFVFYDGPPFANGLPHYGHLLTGYVKDIVPRYQTMRGHRTERRFGWDCHGLPAEMEAEKELGVSGREHITEYGIAKFNAFCRESVMKYTREWEHYVTRQGRWVDFENDYKTMDATYMESVLWALKQLHEKGLLYEGYRVMPYSWAAETPVSNFETRLDDSYRPRQDPAITVGFTLAPQPSDPAPLTIWVWTTTPWTLPSNLALAVGPEIDYDVHKLPDGRHVVLGAAAAAKYAPELEGSEVVGTLKGSDLVDRTYTPLFDYFVDAPQAKSAFRVLGAEFVDTEEGTGVVHMAPGFGEDDQLVCQAHGIEVVCPVDDAGKFTNEVSDFAGLQVFEANKPIIRDLKERGILVRHETYEHNYPHCWRTDQPLIYKAMSSWYVKVTAIRERMVELNQQVAWIPEHIRDGQFGKWLEGARDWSISRNRFWGTPLPIWKSDDPAYPRMDVYGSLDEIEADFGVRPDDLHRPFIDELTRPNPDDPTGKSTMRRIPDVLDCWFESGSMPFASVHYPFENKEWFEEHFPADFIVEYISQTRGWFYTLFVLGTALFDKPPFLNCICHGVVVDAEGKKLSKRLRNYPSPEEVFSSYGSDALRWFLVSSPILRGADLSIDRDGKAIGEVVRLIINPIWNAWYFFALYANADGVTAHLRTDATGTLDRYILGKTRVMVEDLTGAMDRYDLPGGCAVVRSFLDALNNWYIRRSRPRFWAPGHSTDKQDAYDTLYTVLHTVCRAAAPLLPFVTEEIYRSMTGERSVHLADWPDASTFPDERELVEDMDRVRAVCSTALAIRNEKNLRVRLPLAKLTVAGTDAARVDPFVDLIRDECNVKSVETTEDIAAFGSFQLAVNARQLGPKLGQDMKSVLAASKRGEWEALDDGRVRVGDHVLEGDEFAMRLAPSDELSGVALAALPSNDGVVVLDAEPGPELLAEGLARDVVRAIQSARKDADFHVSDRIRVAVDGGEDVNAAVETFRAYIAEQVLADDLAIGADAASGGSIESKAKVAGNTVKTWVAKS